MKLFLTSTVFFNSDITKKVFSKIEKNIKNCKVLFIPNEKATIETLNSTKYLDRVEEWGFSRENIYIFNKYEPEKYFNLDIDILTIGGGNTFGTLDIIRKTGFDKEIIRYIEKDVIFIGGSAGSHVITKNIEHVQHFDSNEVKMTDFNGVGIFDGILICHYTNEREKITKKIIESSNYNVYILTDKDVLYIEDDIIEKY